jgi:hypothetical protein
MENQSILISFDKSSHKFSCPACNKKRFVRFYNYTDNEYLPAQYGRCDREINCGYFLSFTSYLSSKKIDYTFKTLPKENKIPSYLDLKTVSTYANHYESNYFTQFLETIFTPEVVRSIVKEYYMGTSSHWYGSTIFWQVDNIDRVRSGKILLYNKSSGKRVKEPYNHITWYHKSKKLERFNLSQCLFGLHLVNRYPQKSVSIVESEKTACIMSVLAPQTIWMASGSLSNINSRFFDPIYDKTIILYPDASIPNRNGETCYQLWCKKSEELKRDGFKISVSKLLEDKSSKYQKELGVDLADIFIPKIDKTIVVLTQQIVDVPIVLYNKNQSMFNHLHNINPKIDMFIDVFDLEKPF